MANAERIRAVADAIETEKLMRFNMDTYYNEGYDALSNTMFQCGCVAGFAVFMYREHPRYVASCANEAQIILGLTDNERAELFHGYSVGDGRGDIHGINVINARKADVPNALRWMATNDCINWKKAFDALDAINGKIKRAIECPKAPPKITYYVFETVNELETV